MYFKDNAEIFTKEGFAEVGLSSSSPGAEQTKIAFWGSKPLFFLNLKPYSRITPSFSETLDFDLHVKLLS